ncbi:hypothetical protein KSU05_08525 [Fusobacterium nucleatum]|uniref:hypothetical protein n=1 Tax=Fusobacterium nucleatum TaxID=851 RepID=UPI0030D438D5
MLEIYNKTSEKITFKLEGENQLDVRNFGEMLIDTENILKKITSVTKENSSLELKIIAIKEGSFEFDLLAILGTLPELFQGITTAYNLIEAFLEWIYFKNWLKGEEIKQMVNNGNNVIVNKVDGSSHTITNNLNVNIFGSDKKVEEIDKLFVALGSSIPIGRDLTLKANDEAHTYTAKIKEHLETPIQIKPQEDEKVEKSIVTREVIIKKPDLEMKSKWQIYIHNKLYHVDINDEFFKEFVISGRFSAHNGMKLRVDLEEVVRYNLQKETVDIDYTTILKVHPTTETNLAFF